MASIAGWYGGRGVGDDALRELARMMALPGAVTESHSAAGFGLAAVQPPLARPTERIAHDEEDDLTVAFAGYLHALEPEPRHRPAEHCLRLYREHGWGFAEQLNGTFAIAVRDGRSGELHLIADRLSTRELYCAEGPSVLFASEIKPLLGFPGFRPKIRAEQIWQLLAIEELVGFSTLYDGIRQVPPSSVLTWDGRRWQERRYWRLQYAWLPDTTAQDCAERLAEALTAAMERVCPDPDERCLLLLSGGLDSRTVAMTTPRPLDCLTMHDFEDAREVQVARRVAGLLGHPHHFELLPHSYPWDVMRPGAIGGDGVASFRHASPLYVAKAAERLEPSIILSGIWFEVFVGGEHQPKLARSGPARLLPIRRRSFSEDFSIEDHKVTHYQTTSHDVLRRLLPCDLEDVLSLVRSRARAMADRMGPGALAPNDLVELLDGGNVCKQRTNNMVRFIERISTSGTPCWDNEVIQAAMTIPPWLRFGQRAYRMLAQRLSPAAARIINANDGMPFTAPPWRRHLEGSLRARARSLTSALLPQLRLRPLGALPSPNLTLARQEAWRELLRSRAERPRLAELGLVRAEVLRELVEEHIAQRRQHAKLLCIWLTLEEWLDHCEEMGWSTKLAEPSLPASGSGVAKAQSREE